MQKSVEALLEKLRAGLRAGRAIVTSSFRLPDNFSPDALPRENAGFYGFYCFYKRFPRKLQKNRRRKVWFLWAQPDFYGAP